MSEPLAVVPTYIRTPRDLELVFKALETMRATEPDIQILVVDDGSPSDELVEQLGDATSRLQSQLIAKTDNEGFSRTVNVGLRLAHEKGWDAILVNADVEFREPGWAGRMARSAGAVVGARLLYPNGLIQHAGIYFSLLHRAMDHVYRYAPGDLPEALVPRPLPVTGALQYIRWETMEQIGVYDETFQMGYEDVDYCVRAMLGGLVCMYEPGVCAVHHESVFRGVPSPKIADWQQRSWIRFMVKYKTQSFANLVPAVP